MNRISRNVLSETTWKFFMNDSSLKLDGKDYRLQAGDNVSLDDYPHMGGKTGIVFTTSNHKTLHEPPIFFRVDSREEMIELTRLVEMLSGLEMKHVGACYYRLEKRAR